MVQHSYILDFPFAKNQNVDLVSRRRWPESSCDVCYVVSRRDVILVSYTLHIYATDGPSYKRRF